MLILVSIYILMFAYGESRRPAVCHVALGMSLLTFAILNILKIDLGRLPDGAFTYKLAQTVQNLPQALHAFIIIILTIISARLLYKEYRYKQETITRSSIKESMDNLPMGLSFSTNNGLIILSNRVMNKLSHEITGRELRDAESFWQNILAQNQNKQNRNAADKNEAIVKLKDGQTWTFATKEIWTDHKRGKQITAIDITALDQLKMQLEEKNVEFLKMNQRLREYSTNLASIKAKEERLATKAQLHSQLGFILLATRRSLTNGLYEEDGHSIKDLWRTNISILLSGTGLKEKDAFDELQQAAKDIGIALQLQGQIPTNSRIKDIALVAAIEALNNALRHADATTLLLAIEETPEEYQIELTNNGSLPEGEIIEGGGLSDLRRKVEGINGQIGIEIAPAFKLWIKIPNNL